MDFGPSRSPMSPKDDSFQAETIVTVSYTHLDVYKRQVIVVISLALINYLYNCAGC